METLLNCRIGKRTQAQGGPKHYPSITMTKDHNGHALHGKHRDAMRQQGTPSSVQWHTFFVISMLRLCIRPRAKTSDSNLSRFPRLNTCHRTCKHRSKGCVGSSFF
eukprot:TRINITY_DN22241_c0_g1_i1.p3 TRINITY_DN22241_c0_g1~~TRINITY_DN22241_c0_g1_i1.p3  ORF type:complete len:106 (+),score=6.74 TRINITY_DN22241_c0_g1_i1:283-600(+)